MRIGRGKMFTSITGFIVFTAWGYEVSLLEFTAAIVSLIGVYLGTTGKQITWPWWVASSALYAIWFYQAKYYGSFATQFIFIGFGIWGWFGWGKNGARPSAMSLRSKWISLALFSVVWIAFAPYLKSIGAVSIWSDTFGLLGSAAAQILMVRQKWESWLLWLAVDLVLTVQYARGGYYFTSLVYGVFTVVAILGLLRWLKRHKQSSGIQNIA